jgi:hypothetical protein
VRTWHSWLRPFTHLESALENIGRDMMARYSMKKAEETVRQPYTSSVSQGHHQLDGSLHC